MRIIAIVRIVVVLVTLLTTWYVAETIFDKKWEMKKLRSVFGTKPEQPVEKKIHIKCGNEKSCPENYFAFKMTSGAANVVGPSICLEDKIIMSSVKNNIGRGLNIAVINASNAATIQMNSFDMYFGEVDPLLKYLKAIKEGSLVLIASYDDPATKLNDEAREIITSFGSNFAKKLGFRDSWIFIGGKGLKAKSPFEQHLKNEKEHNKYDGWPESLEMEGCIPKKMD